MSRFNTGFPRAFEEHNRAERIGRIAALYERIGYPGTPRRAAWLAEQRGDLPAYTVDADPGDES